jgi:hypothetical protein
LEIEPDAPIAACPAPEIDAFADSSADDAESNWGETAESIAPIASKSEMHRMAVAARPSAASTAEAAERKAGDFCIKLCSCIHHT